MPWGSNWHQTCQWLRTLHTISWRAKSPLGKLPNQHRSAVSLVCDVVTLNWILLIVLWPSVSGSETSQWSCPHLKKRKSSGPSVAPFWAESDGLSLVLTGSTSSLPDEPLSEDCAMSRSNRLERASHSCSKCAYYSVILRIPALSAGIQRSRVLNLCSWTYTADSGLWRIRRTVLNDHTSFYYFLKRGRTPQNTRISKGSCCTVLGAR